MGFTFNNIHTDDMNLIVRTESIPYIAPYQTTKFKVLGLEGEVEVQQGSLNIEIKFECNLVDESLYGRRKKAREIGRWLSNTGELKLDYESDVIYKVVNCINGLSAQMIRETYNDNFDITFVCSPIQKQSFYTDELTLDTLSVGWDYAKMSWADLS